MDIYSEICNLSRQGQRCALATITNTRGSIPSVAAAKMLVRADGSIVGTVGGGCVENDVRKAALEVMRDEKPRSMAFNLNQTPDDDSGLVCGGALQVFVEPILPAPRLYLFGAGHVGLHLSKVAAMSGFEVVVADDREAYANRERFPEAHELHSGDMDRILAALAPAQDAFVVIATRGHRHDMRVLRWALDTPARYIGMIGSTRKVIAIIEQLEAEGVARERFARLHAPIGLKIGAASPEEIAVSIAAELIALRHRCAHPLPHARERVRQWLDKEATQAAADEEPALA